MKIRVFELKRRAVLQLILGALLTWLIASLSATVYAASYVVNDLSDPGTNGDGKCSLREAVTAANNTASTDCGAATASPSTITFSVSGTITMTSNLPGTNNTLTVDGTGQNITLSGNNQWRVFIANGGSVLTLNNLAVTNGGYNSDGATLFNNGTIHISNSTFSNNNAGAATSAAVLENFGAVTIDNSTFSGNTATGNAGVILNAGTMTITNSTFSGNTAGGLGGSPGGGAIYNEGTLTIVNSTFSGNHATGTGSGGGLMNIFGGAVNITNSTFSGNSAPSGGGISNQASSTVTLRNTIIANSTTGGDCANSGTLNADSFNLADNATCGSATQKTSAQINLAALASNGGSTQTMEPGSNSATIDTGNATTCAAAIGSPNYGAAGHDQRAQARDDLQCDVGAFEIKITDTNSATLAPSLSQLTTYGPARAGIQYTGTNPGTTTIVKVTNWTGGTPANTLGAWWDISAVTNTGLNLTLELCYSSTEMGGLTESNLRFWRYSGGTWAQVGGAPTLAGVSPNLCAQISGVTDLSRWTLATGNPGSAPSAVTLSTFDARVDFSSLRVMEGLGVFGIVVLFGAVWFVVSKRVRDDKSKN